MSHTSTSQYSNFITVFMTLFFLLCLSIQSSYCLNDQRNGEQSLPQDILASVSNCLKDSPEDLVRVLVFLTTEDDPNKYIQYLRSVMVDKKTFRIALTSLAKMQVLKENAEFQETMAQIRNDCLYSSQDNDLKHISSPENSKKIDSAAMFEYFLLLSQVFEFTKSTLTGLTSMTKAINFAREMAPSVPQYLKWTLTLADTTLGKSVAVVGLAAVPVAIEVYQSLKLCWDEEISGDRCKKIITDSIVGLAAGVGGGYLGAAIGTTYLPGLGTAIGGAIGGVISYKAASTISDWATLQFFNLPKDVALENAYRFLGLSYGASNDKINTNFYHLRSVYDPSNSNGNIENWNKLQFSMILIKIAKKA